MILKELADSNPKTVSAAASALSASRRYNPNRLVDLLAEDDYSKSALVDIMLAHKDQLNLNHLLGHVYDLQPSEKTAVFKMVQDIATDDQVPDLLPDERQGSHGQDASDQGDLSVRARRCPERIARATEGRQQDGPAGGSHQLAQLNGAVNVELICSLLQDPDVDVIDKAIDVIVNLRHPDTLKYLIPALKDESEFSRRAAVEVLNAIGTTEDIKQLLEAISGDDWWVRARASDALARIGGERVVNAVLELIKDKDEDIRRAAIEILNTCHDPRAVEHLI